MRGSVRLSPVVYIAAKDLVPAVLVIILDSTTLRVCVRKSVGKTFFKLPGKCGHKSKNKGGEMSQWVTCLSCKPQDLSTHSLNPCKSSPGSTHLFFQYSCGMMDGTRESPQIPGPANMACAVVSGRILVYIK